jgi:hypothetical protein
MRCRTTLAAALLAFLASPPATCDDPAPSFNRDVRPILAAKCFACHGPDASHRKAKLRLDERAVALSRKAIVPGDADASELIQRILSEDPDERMPPPDSDKTLSQLERETLRRWVASGAAYEKHWAFVAPVKPALPQVKNSGWPRNPIDHFVLARLESQGLSPSSSAGRYTLVRRVYLDLIGLPPTPEEADEFVHSTDPNAYENLVSRLLESTSYGERWARQWLDLARYADTNGYEKDRPRSIWPYRDWVIRALNADMPFDQFSIEQLAGDMLPGATQSQRIATGFHRNTMLNEEGGIDPLEYRFYAMVDRVATTGIVWMGMTTGCAQCHSHKYDPISHTEYYGLMALLDNADEPDLQVVEADVDERREDIEERIRKLEDNLASEFPPAPNGTSGAGASAEHLEKKLAEWLESAQSTATAWSTLRPHHLETNLPKLEMLDDGSIISTGDITKRDVFKLRFRLDGSAPLTALRLEVLPDERLPAGGPGRAYYEGRKGDFFLSELKATVGGKSLRFVDPSRSYGKIAIGSGNAEAKNVLDGDGSTGWSTAQREGKPHQLVLNLAEPLASEGELEIELLFERHFAASLGRFRFSASSSGRKAFAKETPVEVETVLARAASAWSDEEHAVVKRHFLKISPDTAEARKKIDQLRRKLPRFPTTMVLEERSVDNPRKTHRHHRGEYLSPREEVSAGVPAVFGLDAEKQPRDRLAFARWLVSDRNPLAARVTVNRAWQALFGAGLSRSSGDFGTQSSPSTHPLLLDWLACELVERGWSMKKLHRLIVTSATYRQSGKISRELLRRDPQNRWLARGPRFRVDAEIVRDTMLRASGLLSPKMYGPSVRPPQPDSVSALAYGSPKWKASTGEARYRRSLYTFTKRTAPFAAFTAFDGPSGEACVAERNRSNTPLQALTLLNDEMYLEMSRALGKIAHDRHPRSPDARARFIFRSLLTRPPDDDEMAVLLAYERAQHARLQSGELNPAKIAGAKDASTELASAAMLARTLMNVDEAITKP